MGGGGGGGGVYHDGVAHELGVKASEVLEVVVLHNSAVLQHQSYSGR